MILKPPFIISARLGPALQVGPATLTLMKVENASPRQRANFVLDFPDGRSHGDFISSGHGGFRGLVVMFETFLSFLSAAVESAAGFGDDDNADMFPAWVLEQFEGLGDEIVCVQFSICHEGTDAPNEDLIQ